MTVTQESARPFAVSYRTQEGDQNINGVVHGGVIFHLCDEAVGRYAESLGRSGAAADASIHYYHPGKIGEKLTASVLERKTGRRLGVYLVEVRNEEEKLIADAMFTVAFSA